MTAPARPEVWERWGLAWGGLFAALVGLAAALTLTNPAAPADAPAPTLALAAALLVWYLAGEAHFAGRWAARRGAVSAYFLGGWLIWYGAAGSSPAFLLALFALFPRAFMRLPLRWAVALTAALNGLVLLTLHRIDSALTATWMLLLTGTTLGGGLLALFIDAIIRQSEARARLIAELEAARESLARTEYEAGILHERQRLAGELHDTIIQGLIAIVTQLEAADNAAEPAARQHHLARAAAIARDDLAEARRFIGMTDGSMSDATTDGGALHAELFEHRLRAVAAAWEERSGLPCALHLTGLRPQSLPHPVAHALLRAAQEALNNVSRHARATRVNLTLSWMPDAALLDIHDDGAGFAPGQTTPGSGYGLANMRRRAEALGGALRVESEPGRGTTILVELPLPR